MIDKGSQDETWEIIKTESDKNPKAVSIGMSRNFSLDSAFTGGIDYAETDIAIVMTSGLQDPPEVIPLLLRKYEEDYDQILAKINKRAAVPFSRRIFSKLFYKLTHSARPLAWVSVLGLTFSTISIVGLIALAAFWILFGVLFGGFGSLIGSPL